VRTPDTTKEKTLMTDRKKTSMNILWLVVVIIGWFLVVRFILPALGVST
jgi:hypothetical protein